MASSFPTTIDSFTTKVDGFDTVLASHMNEVQNSIVAIQTNLWANFVMYKTAVAQDVATSSDTVINFETKVSDPQNAVTVGAGWRFDPPVEGVWLIIASILLHDDGADFADGDYASLIIDKNGSGDFIYLDSHTSESGFAVAGYVRLRGSALVMLETTDYIQIEAWQNTGATISLENDSRDNYFHAVLVGHHNVPTT